MKFLKLTGQLAKKNCRKSLTRIIVSAFLLTTLNNTLHAQYLETFSTPNKGYLLSCVNDFAGMNWTLSPWTTVTCAAADPRDPSDYFNTTAAGVLESIDLDQEVYWESPLMSTVGVPTVSLSVGLTWFGFDSDVAANTCLTDYIRVQYSVNGGSYVMVPNQAGGNACATVSYPFANPGTSNDANATIVQGGIAGGSNLKIRVAVFTNANAEIVRIDNVSVPQVGVTLLPVKIISFTGKLNPDKTTTLHWKIADQQDAKEFTVEKSTDGLSFQSIGTIISGSGDTYSFTDAQVSTGKNYYRLKIIEVSGKIHYSYVVVITLRSGIAVSLYPNPVTDKLTIQQFQANQNKTAVLFDGQGKILQQIKLNNIVEDVNMKMYAPGIYILKMEDGMNYKIVKK